MTRKLSCTLMSVLIAISVAHAEETSPPSNAQEALSSSDREILNRGEIGDGAYIGGGIVGTLFGVGIGHAIQGRYTDKGWIFTVGELGSYAIMAAGVTDCAVDLITRARCSTSGTMVAGAVLLTGFRIWEIIDVWAGPPEHNRKYENLKQRVGDKKLSLLASPLGRGGVVGLTYRF